VTDHREHRALTANLLKRTRFFFTYSINDSPRRSRTGGDEALSGRYFEGAAAESVMLGSLTDSPGGEGRLRLAGRRRPPALRQRRPRRRAVTARREPGRVAAIRSAGVRGALRRHDWLRRWERVLSDLDLARTAAMGARAGRLEAVAEASTPERLGAADTDRR
jgi:hypothetical protein